MSSKDKTDKRPIFDEKRKAWSFCPTAYDGMDTCSPCPYWTYKDHCTHKDNPHNKEVKA